MAEVRSPPEELEVSPRSGLYFLVLPKEETSIPGRFYCTFKVHKQYEHGKAQPPKGIVSCSGTLTENIAFFGEHHITELRQIHEAYLQDTPYFPREIETMNQGEDLPSSAMLVVIDVVGLNDNIPPEEGVNSVWEALRERLISKVPAEYIEILLQTILDYSVFEFNQKQYQQKFRTTMATKPATPFANIFMPRHINNKVRKVADKYMENREIPLKFMNRFLDDVFFYISLDH